MEVNINLPDTANINMVDAGLKRGNFKTLTLKNVEVKLDFSDENFTKLIQATLPKDPLKVVSYLNNLLDYLRSQGWSIKDNEDSEWALLDFHYNQDDGDIYFKCD